MPKGDAQQFQHDARAGQHKAHGRIARCEHEAQTAEHHQGQGNTPAAARILDQSHHVDILIVDLGNAGIERYPPLKRQQTLNLADAGLTHGQPEQVGLVAKPLSPSPETARQAVNPRRQP